MNGTKIASNNILENPRPLHEFEYILFANVLVCDYLSTQGQFDGIIEMMSTDTKSEHIEPTETEKYRWISFFVNRQSVVYMPPD